MIKRLAAGALSVSAAGLLALAGWENGPGKPPPTEAYADVAGIYTICTGHTRGVTRGMRATPGECEEWLREDTTEAGQAVGRCVKVPISQAQYDALVSLAFNIGGGAFCGSSLVARLNAGDCFGAADQFQWWRKSGGKVQAGLVKRRAAEKNTFVKDCAAPGGDTNRPASHEQGEA